MELLSLALWTSIAAAPARTIPARPPLAQSEAASRPAATSIAKSWIEDLDALARELPKCHKNAFFQLPRQEFEAKVAALRARIPELSDGRIVVELRRLVASLGDGHTAIVTWKAPPVPPGIRNLPIQAIWLSDGIFASALPPAHAALLGQRIVRIGSAPIADAIAALTPLRPIENESAKKTYLCSLLRESDTLAALGLAPDAEDVTLTLADAAGKETTIPLFLPPREIAPASAPAASRPAAPAMATKPEQSALPNYRKQGRFSFGHELLADSKALYVWYDTCQNLPNKNVADFAAEALAALDAGLAKSPPAIEKVVVDLRRNGGGDSQLLDPLISGLRDRTSIQGKNRLIALIGRGTFSSAMMNAIALRDRAHARLVGEPTGGKPNTYGEVKSFELPRSKILVQYSTKFFRDIPEDLDAVPPDVRIEPDSQSYFSGRDAALEAAIALR